MTKLTPDTTDGGSPVKNVQAAESLVHAKAMGAYISMIGVALFIYAIRYLLWPNNQLGEEAKAAQLGEEAKGMSEGVLQNPIVLLGLIAIALFCIFSAFNAQNWPAIARLHLAATNKGFDVPRSQVVRWLAAVPNFGFALFRAGLVIVSILLLALTGYKFSQIHKKIDDPRSIYTITLPGAGEVDALKADQQGSGDPAKPEAAKEGGELPVLLSWSVEANEVSEVDALTKMILAAGLIFLFGAGYARIVQASEQRAGAVWDKLVIPSASAFLFAAGASEQTEAKDLNKNINLMRKADHAIAGLDPSETRNYVRNYLHLPDSGKAEIDGALAALEKRIGRSLESQYTSNTKVHEGLSDEIRKLQGHIGRLPRDVVIAENPQLEAYIKQQQANIVSLMDEQRKLQASSSKSVEATRKAMLENKMIMAMQTRQLHCTLELSEIYSKFAVDLERESLRRAMTKDERNALKYIWFGFVGEPTKDSKGKAYQDILAALEEKEDEVNILKDCYG